MYLYHYCIRHGDTYSSGALETAEKIYNIHGYEMIRKDIASELAIALDDFVIVSISLLNSYRAP